MFFISDLYGCGEVVIHAVKILDRINADAVFVAVGPADAPIEQTDRQPKPTLDQIEKSEV